jgi:chemosensory pili system protein ChpA (sensor histidine kinase/response regulator)
MVSVNTAAGAALQRGRLAAIPTEADGTSGADDADDSTTAKAPRHLSVVREAPAVAEAVEAVQTPASSAVADALSGADAPKPKEQSGVEAAQSEDANANLEEEQRKAVEQQNALPDAEQREVEAREVVRVEAAREVEAHDAEQREAELHEVEALDAERVEAERRESERVAMPEAAERAVNVSAEAIAEASKQVSELSVAAIEAATNEQAIQAELSELAAEVTALQSRLAEKTTEANRAAERTRDAASQRAAAEETLSAAIREASKAKEALAILRSDAPGP